MSNTDIDNIKINPFVEESFCILHEAYKSKKLVLFVGAGADVSSGLPLWSSAIEQFCKHMNISSEDADNLRIPQYYYNSRGKKEYVELSRDIFGYEKEFPINDIHKKIIDFNVNTIITTNYTHFLEREMKNRGYIYRVICQDKDLAYAKHENLIIKMHGDFEHDNFVLKEDDYLNYSNNFRLIETYIKSVIAANVVLFIGYSYNDPDVKQLFSWVKDILGEDFQHAYMLEGFKNYDKNAFDYYRNLGVYVIYTNVFNEDNTKALLTALDMIRLGNKEYLSNVDSARDYFLPYLNFNYILNRYLYGGLRKCNLIVEAGVLKNLRHCLDEEDETNKLLIKLSERIEEKTLQSDDAYSVIVNILQRSGIDTIKIIDCEGGKKKQKKIDIPHIGMKNELFDLIIEFDYINIKRIADDNDIINNGDDEQFYLQQAYLYYVLEDYAKAYKALCSAAEKSFHKHQYYTYYIAQFDKFRIGEYIKGEFNISSSILNKIDEDLDRIDLDRIITDMPDLSSNDNRMLKDIGSFQIHYSLFQNSYRIAEKVKEQQNNIYSFFSGLPDYIALQWMVIDYYRYLVYNHLMVDKYQESKEIFVLYIKTILENVSAPDMESNIKMMDLDCGGNIHATKIGKFELFLIVKYMSKKGFINIISQYNIDSIPVCDGCNSYMKVVLNNLKLGGSVKREMELWNCIMVIPFINPDYDLVEDTIDCISEKFSTYIYRTQKETINRFLGICYKNNKFKNRQEGEFQINDYALGRFLANLIRQVEHVSDTSDIQCYSEILQYVLNVFHSTYNECFEGDIKSLICVEKALLIAGIFSYCNEENKRVICQYFEKWKGSATSDACEIYYTAVINEVIEPRKDFEQMIIKNIDKIEENSRGAFPNAYQDILTIMYNLYINNKLILVKEYLDIIKASGDDELIFLSDMNEFDYNKFKLEWLNSYHGGLVDVIAHNTVARFNISKIFAEKVEYGEINNKLLKVYFKYFANITEES